MRTAAGVSDRDVGISPHDVKNILDVGDNVRHATAGVGCRAPIARTGMADDEQTRFGERAQVLDEEARPRRAMMQHDRSAARVANGRDLDETSISHPDVNRGTERVGLHRPLGERARRTPFGECGIGAVSLPRSTA